MKRVLLLLDHAPNYREAFLRELSKYFDLNVVAHPCGRDDLVPPIERLGYNYIELKYTWGDKIRVNFELPPLIQKLNPDVICVALNPRYPIRAFNFIFSGSNKRKWIWWGQIFGRTKNTFLDRGREWLLKNSFGALVYTEEIAQKLSDVNVISFNNSQYSEKEFRKLDNYFSNGIRFLFVGRPQKRKKLQYILEIAKRYPNFHFRMVGPGMREYFKNIEIPLNVGLFPGVEGDPLASHFNWSNIIINPGHVGLLVMNAACHCRPIIINSKVDHAPEVLLAKEAGQFFIDFNDNDIIDSFLKQLQENPLVIKQKGEELYFKCINKYTIEKMVEKHRILFDKV